MSSRRPIVVDASVIIAVALGEPGSASAAPRLFGAQVNPVNLAESIIALVRRGLPRGSVERLLAALQFQLVPCDWALCQQAAEFHAATRPLGLSLADAFCLASAHRLDALLLTADRAWAPLQLGVEIEVIR